MAVRGGRVPVFDPEQEKDTMRQWFVTGLLLAVGLAGQASAGFDEGKAAFEQQDYTKAFQELQPLAKAGNAPAEYLLGLLYAEGRGVDQDPLAAVDWYRKAAEQGYARAQFSFGVACFEGLVISQNFKEAAHWFRLAAEQGDGAARFNLAMMYSAGNGVPQDSRESVKWLRLAAEQGIGEAQNNLAIAYDSGQGVRHSDVAAYALYSVAITNEISPSRKAAGNRTALAEKMLAEEIRVAQALAGDMAKSGKLLTALDQYLQGQ